MKSIYLVIAAEEDRYHLLSVHDSEELAYEAATWYAVHINAMDICIRRFTLGKRKQIYPVRNSVPIRSTVNFDIFDV